MWRMERIISRSHRYYSIWDCRFCAMNPCFSELIFVNIYDWTHFQFSDSKADISVKIENVFQYPWLFIQLFNDWIQIFVGSTRQTKHFAYVDFCVQFYFWYTGPGKKMWFLEFSWFSKILQNTCKHDFSP